VNNALTTLPSLCLGNLVSGYVATWSGSVVARFALP
jgi:hypothetical protein